MRRSSSLIWSARIIAWEIGERLGATVVNYHKVPVVEVARNYIHDKVKHDWILFVDPDEVIQPALIEDIKTRFGTPIDDQTCRFELPWQFYFGKKFLKGTFWGGTHRYKGSLVHRERVLFSDNVHRDLIPKEGYDSERIDRQGDNYIQHNWMTSYRQLVRKHKRYLKREGESLYNAGVRYSWKQHITAGWNSFRRSFFRNRGYKDGLTGFALSVFWGW